MDFDKPINKKIILISEELGYVMDYCSECIAFLSKSNTQLIISNYSDSVFIMRNRCFAFRVMTDAFLNNEDISFIEEVLNEIKNLTTSNNYMSNVNITNSWKIRTVKKKIPVYEDSIKTKILILKVNVKNRKLDIRIEDVK